VRAGTCCCGEVRIQADGEPLTISMCHCLLCQKRTGSTYSVHAYFPTSAVTIEGKTRLFSRSADSGGRVDFHFCPGCGATIYWRLGSMADRTGIPVGIFADPSFPPPQVAIFVPHKHPWVTVPNAIPQHDAHSPTFYANSRQNA
jgi:hypothetical protein